MHLMKGYSKQKLFERFSKYELIQTKSLETDKSWRHRIKADLKVPINTLQCSINQLTNQTMLLFPKHAHNTQIDTEIIIITIIIF